MEEIEMQGVTEYCEEMTVMLSATSGIYESGVPDEKRKGYGRVVIKAFNEGGFNCTEVDLFELISWIRLNMPGLLA